MPEWTPWLVGLPLVGFCVNGLAGLLWPRYRRWERWIGALSTGLVLGAFAIALGLFLGVPAEELPLRVVLYPWIASGDFAAAFAFRLDALSLLMALIVTGVGALIHLYSIGYMRGEAGYWRYFAHLNLFIAAMLLLVLADNLLLLFLGWEGVGLCSYLLIGHGYEDPAKAFAARKAFVVNRIGDFAFLVGLLWLFREVGSLDLGPVLERGSSIGPETLAGIGLLLFIGATGKSAQIPLFVWLPDAMAGPTPVSALIHAATMVTAGVYLFARLSPLYGLSPDLLAFVAAVGLITALMAATIALTQYDIKKVLAYSTISQLGFMFLGVGVGAFSAAIFHVLTHAFFKAALFLGAGAVIHALKGEQDIRRMGGLRAHMPWTYRVFLLASLAMAGLPPLAGFFSKDKILAAVLGSGGLLLWALALLGAALTAAYIMRLCVLVFHGPPRAAYGAHPHEAPLVMLVPLVLLGLGSLAAGWLGWPSFVGHGAWDWIGLWLAASVVDEPHELPIGLELGALLVSALVALVGAWAAWRFWGRHGLEADRRLERRLGSFYALCRDQYRVDALYERLIVRPMLQRSERPLRWTERHLVGGLTELVSWLALQVGLGVRRLASGFVSLYALLMLLGALGVLLWFLWRAGGL
ncbi:MAG: NADH-quinone oxidoreductase subunit L [Bacteroidetes bacterium]|nr:NADH-quinone oxidoreductase subunit L [Rhodothermia bacterium]MCS7155714.1 NADH-quinone oxidoreductase subunit L [Bacteroidota bacterium]MCX7906568.1 NADH-quinone oxidoreductase subunit L [Bacteroidota bacterium]MDW8137151.1 NADH-quinone oxidoreductase subunit L [Bacteroidota bacterium]MDW8284979.1 NADH-quinone oxidoreductase subunit L [Bacteroidota bacterium]